MSCTGIMLYRVTVLLSTQLYCAYTRTQYIYTSKIYFVILPRMLCFQDLNRYPRQLERDLELLGAEGLADFMFAPNAEEMYSRDHR